ncbi:hypothetical protein N7456_008142 [Penicillium angulare]|uniref:C2H2-type domain-containing protein n=1 Tax=Penicillium angulare TaxID=116970 RepID=A0A9W9FC66_9EURO|nr:hypothetical protein N7456_008142 [Penicillium angulare]
MPAVRSGGLLQSRSATRPKDTPNKNLPSPPELFKYFPLYEILICTTCRYALKPGGVARHLKDIHRLQNDQRRPYTLYASNFVLKSPEDVSSPPDHEFPVAYLPLEQGWRCRAPGCDYLCASIKRMETHWPSKHGSKGNPSHDWTSAPLQTFFRGNSLRYFTTNSPNQLKPNSQSLPGASGCIQKMRYNYELDAVDSLMLEHYFYSSYQSFSKNSQTEKVWLNVIADLASRHRFLIHGILACTALHMAHIYPLQRELYVLRAYSHQDTALPLFRNELDYPTAQNCDAIMAFGYLLVVFSFATELDNGQNSLLVINDTTDGPKETKFILPQWLHFIRVGCEMLDQVWDQIEKGPARALADAWEIELDVGDSKLPYLEEFVSFIPEDGSWSEKVISVYRDGASTLADAFAYMDSESIKPDVSTWNILGLWFVRLDNEFYDLIFERHPGALILLAWYCVIMKRMESCWYFGGRPARLIASITDALDTRWHPCIKDAADQVIGS